MRHLEAVLKYYATSLAIIIVELFTALLINSTISYYHIQVIRWASWPIHCPHHEFALLMNSGNPHCFAKVILTCLLKCNLNWRGQKHKHMRNKNYNDFPYVETFLTKYKIRIIKL
jgi:hypothetical protein